MKRKLFLLLLTMLLVNSDSNAQSYGFIKLHLYDNSNNSWDVLYLSFNQQASNIQDNNDALKLGNTDLNFYSISADNIDLSIDARPYVSGQVIPLGIETDVFQTYVLKIETFGAPVGAQVLLHDNYLHQVLPLQLGTQYSFTITADTASQGNNRFNISTLTTSLWTGATGTGWNTTTNWGIGGVPTNGDSVSIPAGVTNMPVISSGTYTIGSLTQSSGTLTLGTGVTLNITGSISNNGTINGAGNMVLNGTAAQTITGTGTISNLMLSNTTGATITTGSNINITGTYTNTAGTLTTNGGLTLISNASGTARIAPVAAGGISGNVNMQQYIPGGRRAFRFFSHPFNAPIPLSQLETTMDITGNGGSANGFTSTVTNNPSAFWYNTATGNGSITNDIGWTAFTAMNGAGSNGWAAYEGIRLLVRGAQGQGLNGNTYTPNPVTFTLSGAVNQGAITIPFTIGPNSGYNLLGNPYPSPTDIGTPIYTAKQAGAISGAGFWVWDANQQLQGGYVTVPIVNSPYSQPANAAYIINAASNGNLAFTETNKVSSSNTLFKTTGDNGYVTLHLYDSSSNSWDVLYLSFNQNASAGMEDNDAVKMHNTNLDFYSLSSDNKELSIDARPYEDGQVIPLGIQTNVLQAYSIKTESLTIPAGAQLMLHDKYLDQYQQLQQGSQYSFTITADTASQGNNRFEIVTLTDTTTAVAAINSNNNFTVKIFPNPATDKTVINYLGAQTGEVTVNVVDVTGRVVYTTVAIGQSGAVAVPLQSLPPGYYLIATQSGDRQITVKLVKE